MAVEVVQVRLDARWALEFAWFMEPCFLDDVEDQACDVLRWGLGEAFPDASVAVSGAPDVERIAVRPYVGEEVPTLDKRHIGKVIMLAIREALQEAIWLCNLHRRSLDALNEAGYHRRPAEQEADLHRRAFSAAGCRE